MRIFRTVILSLILIGCTSIPEADKFKNQTPPESKPGHALIYVYREGRLAYNGNSVLIRDGDKSLALLSDASYSYFWLGSGHHTLSSFAWGRVGGTEYTGDFQDGGIYYLRIEFEKFDPNLTLMEAAFVPVESDVAKDEIGNLGLSHPDK